MNIAQPLHHLIDGMRIGRRRQIGSCHHDNRETQLARGLQLGGCRPGTGILGDDNVDLFVTQQRALIVKAEGTSRGDDMRVWQSGIKMIYRAHQIIMLWGAEKRRDLKLADGQKNTLRHEAKSGGGARHIGNIDPAIPRTRGPGRTLEAQQRYPHHRRGGHSMSRDLRGERMRCINKRLDFLVAEKFDQSLDATKAANSVPDGRGKNGAGSSGKGHQRTKSFVVGQNTGKRGGLAGAAEYQDIRQGRRRHVV